MWDGGELNGKRIVLHNEQGFGDVIQFVRYIPQVLKRGGRISLSCEPVLHRLFQQQNWPIEHHIAFGQAQPEYDVQCPLMSLPLVLGTTLQTIPANVPYLSADAELAQRWKSRLPDDNRLKVGIAWANKPAPPNRCPPPRLWSELGYIPGLWFCSLQKPVRGIMPPAPGDLKVTDWSDELADFADTAALIENLDLVISVDTAVPHLAGAMGKPVWVPLKYVPDWRWMLKREDSPWYPSMRLFRQSRLDDWDTPMSRITEELRKLVEK